MVIGEKADKKPGMCTVIPTWARSYLTKVQRSALEKTRVSLRSDQLILVNKVVDKKEVMEKGLEEEEK
jgi:hypothetical protein